ncbi:MAG: cell division protein SepF [Lachnospiraceae bacterium]
MSVLDKFMDIMRMSDEEDDEYYDGDDFFDEEELEEEEYDEKPRKKKKGKTHEDFEEERPSKSRSNKVTPMRQPAKRSSGMEVCVIKPTSVDDSREITETLLGNSTVILNLEGIDLEVAQRIIDFTSGATFAIDGNLQKISNFIFLVTPTNVDISGDLQDLLSTSFDVPSVRTRF